MKKLLFTLFMLIVSTKSFSQSNDEYQYVTLSSDGSTYYVHLELCTQDTKKFWLKIISPNKTSKSKSGKIIKKGGDFTVKYLSVDCSFKEYTIYEESNFDKNGNLISSEQFSSYDRYSERIMPGTVMSAIYKYVCR